MGEALIDRAGKTFHKGMNAYFFPPSGNATKEELNCDKLKGDASKVACTKKVQLNKFRRSLFLSDSLLKSLEQIGPKHFNIWRSRRAFIASRYSKTTETLPNGQKKSTLGKKVCEMSFQSFVTACNTCCCKNGMMQTAVQTKLTTNIKKDGRDICGNWFSLVDLIGRTWVNANRVTSSSEMVRGCAQ